MPIPDNLMHIKSFETHRFNTRMKLRYPRPDTLDYELLERMWSGPIDLAQFEDYPAWRKAICRLIAYGFVLEIECAGEGPMLVSAFADYFWFIVTLSHVEALFEQDEAEGVGDGDMH